MSFPPKRALQTAIQLNYISIAQAQALLTHWESLPPSKRPDFFSYLCHQLALNSEQIHTLQTHLNFYKTSLASTVQEAIPGYKILSKLGQGGMGVVYKAVQLRLERVVALKILSPHLTKSPQHIQRMSREAKILAKLNHPNIVAVYDFHQYQGLYYLVMEFVDGESLDKPLKRGEVFDLPEALKIIRQVALALEEAHRQGLIHRDIKPANIMRDQRGLVKLCDLGLAREVRLHEKGMTDFSDTAGTPVYMSPEQCSGQALDELTDIYSLGATFFHLITGHRPFQAAGIGGIYAQILSDYLPDPRQYRSSIPAPVASLIQKMMAKDKRHRFQSAQELLVALDRIEKQERAQRTLRGHTVRTRSYSSEEKTLPAKSSKKLWWSVPLLGLASILTIAFFWLTSSPLPKPIQKKMAKIEESLLQLNVTDEKEYLSFWQTFQKLEKSLQPFLKDRPKLEKKLATWKKSALIRLQQEIQSLPQDWSPEARKTWQKLTALVRQLKKLSIAPSQLSHFEKLLEQKYHHWKQSFQKEVANWLRKNGSPVFLHLRKWEYDKALSALPKVCQKAPFPQAVEEELQRIISNAQKGYTFFIESLEKLHREKKTFVMNNISYVTVKLFQTPLALLVRNPKHNGQIFFFPFLSLSTFLENFQKFFPDRHPEWKKYPFFFLFSQTPHKATHLPSRYKNWIALEKQLIRVTAVSKLLQMLPLFIRQKQYRGAHTVFVYLKVFFKDTPSFQQNYATLKTLYAKVLHLFLKNCPLDEFLNGKLLSSKEDHLKIEYTTQNPYMFQDWQKQSFKFFIPLSTDFRKAKQSSQLAFLQGIVETKFRLLLPVTVTLEFLSGSPPHRLNIGWGNISQKHFFTAGIETSLLQYVKNLSPKQQHHRKIATRLIQLTPHVTEGTVQVNITPLTADYKSKLIPHKGKIYTLQVVFEKNSVLLEVPELQYQARFQISKNSLPDEGSVSLWCGKKEGILLRRITIQGRLAPSWVESARQKTYKSLLKKF